MFVRGGSTRDGLAVSACAFVSALRVSSSVTARE